MWAFLSRRFRRYVVFAVGVPLAAKFADMLADELEQRGRSDALTKGLHSGGSWLRGRSKGPAARRDRSRSRDDRRSDAEAGDLSR